jgi:hypothetical protein
MIVFRRNQGFHLYILLRPAHTWEEKATHGWLFTFSPAENPAWIVQLDSSLIAAGNS